MSSGALIYFDENPVAFGEDAVSGWENYQAWTQENLSWKNIFSNVSTPGKDLYKFVGTNLLKKPDKEAVKVIASIYHLTEQEADKAIKGSIAVLLNNTATPKRMTTEQAYKMQKDIKDDYESFKELFDIKQEIDTAVTPTEMFSNGDLQDSGFDLIYDLNVIEKIMFNDVTEVTSGKPLTEDEGNVKSFIDAMPITPKPKKEPAYSSKTVAITSTVDANGNVQQAAEIKIGDEVIDAEIGEDVCPANNPLADALDQFNDKNPPGSEHNPNGAAGGPAGPGGPGAGNQPGGNNQPGQNPAGAGAGVTPAQSDEWGSGFCGAEPDNPEAPAFISLSGEQGGAAAGAQSFGFSVNVALCIKVEMIKEKAVATSSSSCVQCEVDKINKAFNETLSHSLIPNKTTGNIMESATCKKSFSSLLDFKVHLVGNPLPADPADDLIFGKNILAEWNKFVDRYKPSGFGKWDKDTAEEFAFNYVPPDMSGDEFVLSMEAAKAKNTASILKDLKAVSVADEGTNMMLFSATVLNHMKEMNGYYDAYRATYENIVETCRETENAKSI